MKKRNIKSALNISAIIFACVDLLAFVIIAILVGCKHQFRIDSFNGWVANHRNGTLTEFFETITSLGSFYVLGIIVLIAFLVIAFHQKKLRLACFMGGAFSFASLLNVVIKFIFKRPRPEMFMIVNQSGYSFASGHSVMATCVLLLAIYYVSISIKNKPLMVVLDVIFGSLIAIVCFSRVYLGVHYVSDVLAGICLSSGCVLLFMVAYQSKIFKFLKDKNRQESLS